MNSIDKINTVAGLSDTIPLGLGCVLQSPGDCLSFSRQDVQTPARGWKAPPTGRPESLPHCLMRFPRF